MNNPAVVVERLSAIERDLAERQVALEDAALAYYRSKRDREEEHARAFLAAEGTVAQRQAKATLAVSHIGRDDEGKWEGLKAVVRTLDVRASIGMAILKAQTRGGA